VGFGENNNLFKGVFHDGDRLREIIGETVPDIITVRENLNVSGRALGNGRSDNIILSALDLGSGNEAVGEAGQNFQIISGSFADLARPGAAHPALVSAEKARFLKVGPGDQLRVSFQDLHGQMVAAQLAVAGIFKPANTFLSSPVFLEVKDLKALLGYAPHDVAQICLTIKNPQRNSVEYADRLHQRLQPRRGAIYGGISSASGQRDSAAVFGMRTDSLSRAVIIQAFPLARGDTTAAFGSGGVVVSGSLARSLGLALHAVFNIKYAGKYDSATGAAALEVQGITADTNGPKIVLVNDRQFYGAYYGVWPADTRKQTAAVIPDSGSRLSEALAPEWLLFKRAKTTEEIRRQYKFMSLIDTRAVRLDVRSMYESASLVINLEAALKLITFTAVLVLFLIVLVGVANSLRMSIRERTREIGTLRALGMQKSEVRNSFILETLLLTFFASLAGTLAAFLVMALLSAIPLPVSQNPLSILLVDRRLYFAPTVFSVISCNVLLLVITAITAWLPSRKAAEIPAAEALRHYE
jgi:ABC-type lipoprotein release transport system permease subunit